MFICTNDPFEENLPVYTFERVCRENNNIDLKDKTHHIIFNASAWEKEKDIELKDFLAFVNNNIAKSDFTKEVANMVEAKKFENTFLNEYFAWNLHDKDVERKTKENVYIDLIKSGLISPEVAAMKLGIPEAELQLK